MRILIIGDFQNDSPRFIVNNTRKFAKGFIRNGHDVLAFSYREQLFRLSPFKGKTLSAWFAKDKTDDLLVSLAWTQRSEIVLVSGFKLIDEQTVIRLREALPQATFMCWYGDLRRGADRRVLAIARHCDWFTATSSGGVLECYKAAGAKNAAFMPNPSDPDVEHPYDAPPEFHSQVTFIGKISHSLPDQDPMRDELLRRLYEQGILTVWGCFGRPTVDGLDAFYAISGAKIALSINAFNDVPMYHSDRLIRLMACGAFVVAKRVPETERLFEDGKHLVYFDTIDQCRELIKRYLADDSARNRIAAAGMQHAHTVFNAQKLAVDFINLAQGKPVNAPWAITL
ncbi:MAG: glycosyltransferase [Sedimentisphaerales bacterium]|nr:glycosyltransferase [Sedimentisphaerales bacterium]